MKTIVNLLILFSQFINVIVGGRADEMFCARAWRLQADPVWGTVRLLLDTAYPLSQWKGVYSSHCEACYQAEKKRLTERLRVYSDQEPLEISDVQEG